MNPSGKYNRCAIAPRQEFTRQLPPPQSQRQHRAQLLPPLGGNALLRALRQRLVVREVFESSRRGNGLKEICRELNDRGIINKGNRWHKSGHHLLLTNETYTGTAIWGRTTKGEQNPDPVRVENAWPALVSRDLFNAVQQALHERAPTE